MPRLHCLSHPASSPVRRGRVFPGWIPAFFLLLALPPATAQILPAFDRHVDALADSLLFESPGGFLALQAGLQADLTVFYRDTEGGPPGFFFPKNRRTWTTSPRLTFTFEGFVGDQWFAFAKLRLDDGVHPGVSQFYGEDIQKRWDELFLRWTPSSALKFQAGQFTPIIGNFFSRQNAWNMGLISYPALYENFLSVSDGGPPASPEAFAARRLHPDNKATWLPFYWAPLYSIGASAFGSSGPWEYALNFANSAPSSRGIIWNNFDFEYPTWLGRFGRSFGPAWNLGLNATTGPYFRPDYAHQLPPGTTLHDYRQDMLGLDLRFARGPWQIWSEAFVASFQVPNVPDDAVAWSYYVETRYQWRPGTWLSARWNQEWHNRITTANGRERWDNPLIRLDLGLGHRFGRHLQGKFQYTYQHQDAAFQNGRHFLVTEWTFKL